MLPFMVNKDVYIVFMWIYVNVTVDKVNISVVFCSVVE